MYHLANTDAAQLALRIDELDNQIVRSREEHDVATARHSEETARHKEELADVFTKLRDSEETVAMARYRRRVAVQKQAVLSNEKKASQQETSKCKIKLAAVQTQLRLEKLKSAELADLVKEAQELHDAAILQAAVGDGPLAPPGLGGGGEPAPDTTATEPALRRFSGNPLVKRNVRRWCAAAKASLAHFDTHALAATVRALHGHLDDANAALALQVKRLSFADALTMLHPTVLARIEKQGAKTFRNAIQEHWDITTCTEIKYANALSRSKYDRLRRSLSCIFNSDKRKKHDAKIKIPGYSVQSCLGVPFPRLASRDAIKDYVDEIAEASGLRTFADGLGATVDVRVLLAANILESLESGHYIVEDNKVVQADGTNVDVVALVDAANHHKGMKLTAAAVVLPHGCDHPMSPQQTHEYANVECGDNHAGLTGQGRPLVDAVNDLIANPFIDIDGLFDPDTGEKTSCELEISGSGDRAFVAAAHCITSCNTSNPCTECVVPKERMTDTRAKYRQRTLDGIRLRTHTAVGTCPCCNLEIVDVSEGQPYNKKKQTPLLFGPCTNPPKGSVAKHEGLTLGQAPPYNMEPWMWCICLLHMRLCVIGGMFKRLIIDHLETAEQFAQAHEIMKNHGIEVKESKYKKSSKKLQDYELNFKSWGMAGRDTEVLTYIRNLLCKVAYPASKVGEWVPDDVLFGSKPEHEAARKAARTRAPARTEYDSLVKVRTAWHKWELLWGVLNSDLGLHGHETWEDRAQAVKSLADAFVVAHVAATGKATQGLYLHLIHAHLPDHIRRWGDLRLRQAQGLEHRHKLRKRIGCECTNRRKGQRVEQMLRHYLVTSFLERYRASTASTAAKQKQDNDARAQRAKRKIERLAAVAAEVEAAIR
jgi:hypothetical protein